MRKIKFEFFLLLLLLLWEGIGTAGGLDQTRPENTYPDVWYRLYDWPIHVCDKFFSDKEIWGDEPVLILCNGNQREAVAEGFFSKKRRFISIRDQRIRANVTETRYFYKNTRRMQVRKLFPADPGLSYLEFSDGDVLIDEEESGLWWAGEYSRPDRKNIHPPVRHYECQPISKSFARYNQANQFAWAKSVVRYYRKGLPVPPHEYGKGVCDGYKAWLSTGAEDNPLLLADGSLLVSGYPFTYVVRIRGKDGNSKKLPSSLKVIDRQALRNAKEDIIQRYLAEKRKSHAVVSPGGDVPTVEKSYDTERHPRLEGFREFSSPEQLYRMLAGYFFEETEQQGDVK